MPSSDANNPPIHSPIQLALFEPDIPQNTGAILRTAACFACVCHVIEPAGFVLDDSRMKRAGMDYLDLAAMIRHDSWQAFLGDHQSRPGRLIAASTRGAESLATFQFQPQDTLLMGRESAGLPDHAWAECDQSVFIPIAADARSLNVAQATAILASFALAQLSGWPAQPGPEAL